LHMAEDGNHQGHANGGCCGVFMSVLVIWLFPSTYFPHLTSYILDFLTSLGCP
jgi:hypothetical protein